MGLAAWFVLNVISQEVKPGVREATEDTLVDTANLLAEQAALDFKAGNIAQGSLAQSLHTFRARPLDAAIRGINKRSLEYRVYLTDARGIVVYSTEPEQIGQDFSHWRDVYLTLHGQYGARTSRDVREISLTQAGHHIRPEVRDHGPGVPDYALDQVFERFFSLPRPATGKKARVWV